MANLVAMLRLPGNLKSTQWQILAGPLLILLILLDLAVLGGFKYAGFAAETVESGGAGGGK